MSLQDSREVKIGKKIGGTELGWCLGATIAMVGYMTRLERWQMKPLHGIWILMSWVTFPDIIIIAVLTDTYQCINRRL